MRAYSVFNNKKIIMAIFNLTTIAAFLAGTIFGQLPLTVILTILRQRWANKKKSDDSPFNEDGTPKHISFK